MKKLLALVLCLLLTVQILPVGIFTFTASAATEYQSGYYYYTLSNGKATITNVKTSISGAVTIPSILGGYPVAAIGDYAFYECDSLTNITIPDSATTIGANAFHFCYSLTSVTIGNGVTSIGDYAFSYCSSLTSITIPDNVTSIGAGAFDDCKSLYSVTIGDGVTTIGQDAFNFCDSITSVTIGNSVTTIGDSAFYLCTSLTNINIPDSVTTIGAYAFYFCTSLTSVTIPDSVTSIGYGAFDTCIGLTSITIPDSVTSIGEAAFACCTRLVSFSMSDNNAFYCVVDGVLFNKNRTAIIAYPARKTGTFYAIPSSVTTIGDSAFSQCTRLTSITIPDSVTSIGASAFSGCDSLTNITIPDSVTSIGDYTFEGCDNLTSVTIGNGVTSIGDYAFYGYKSLASVTIGNSVTSIGDSAFSGCDSLTNITIPDSVTSIGDYAFEGCDNLTSVTIGNGVTSVGEFALDSTAWYKKQPAGLVYAGKVAYKYKGAGPSSIVIKKGTVAIANYAFADCDSLTSIIIPYGVTSIGDHAFDYCYFLTSITIPDSVTSIGTSAFRSCSNLASVTIGNSVTSIGGRAFSGCDSLTNITIPDSVTSIGDYTFEGCSNLTSVTIGNGVTSIGDYAFSECTGLTSVTIPSSVTSIGKSAFYKCKSLTSISIPSSVTSIGEAAFACCTRLVSFSMSDNNAFYCVVDGVLFNKNRTAIIAYPACKTGTFYAIPSSVTSIGDHAFYYCHLLTSITIPSSVTSIGDSAFYLCTSLTNITVPDSVTSIGTSAFNFCYRFTDVWYGGTEQDKAQIFIGSDNDYLLNATWHYHEHTYDSPCDAICNGCGDVRTPEAHKVWTEDIAAFTDDTNYPFMFIDGVYQSTNKDNNSTATATFQVVGDGSILLEYYTSTEEGYDELIIKHNNTTKVTQSGTTSWASITIDVSAGDTVSISYSKDISQSSGNDAVYFKIDSSGWVLAEDVNATCEGAVVCDVCGETVKQATGHIYDNAQDADCNACGETRTITPSFEDVSPVFAQLQNGISASSQVASIRFVAAIQDRLSDFDQVGFVLSLSNSEPTVGGINCTVKGTSTVYSAIMAGGTKVPASKLGGSYIFALSLNNIPNASFGTDIYVRAYVLKKDGSYSYSDVKSYNVTELLGGAV